MARGHEIKIASDTRDFELGIRNGVIDPLDDAERELGRLADAAEDAGRDAARGLDRVGDAAEDAGREGARGIDRLEDALRDAQRQSERTERAVEDIDVRGRSAFGGMGEAAQEVTQEIGGNLGEAVSSVRGNLADLGQVGQDTLGGLASTLAGTGPAGIAGAAALAAGAVGLGLMTAELEKQQEEADKLRERLSAAWQAAAEEGLDYLDVAALIAESNDLMFNPERAEEYKNIREDAKTLALDEGLLIKANAGDIDALRLVQERINSERTEAESKITDIRTRGASRAQAEAQQEARNLTEISDRWQAVADVTTEYRERAAQARRTTSDMLMESIRGFSTVQEEVDEVGNKLLTLPDGMEIVIDAETGLAHQNVERFRGDLDEVPKTITTRAFLQAHLSYATAQYNKWIRDHDGRSIKIYGRYITPPGAENW